MRDSAGERNIYVGHIFKADHLQSDKKFHKLREPMKFTIRCIQVAVAIATAVVANASATQFETGWLDDKKGSTESKLGAKVIIALNMNGSEDETGKMQWKTRYVAIEIPAPKINAKTIIVLDKNERPIQHSDAEAFEYDIRSGGTKGTIVKLFLDRPAGFAFRLRFNN